LVATLIEDPEQSAHTVTLAPELIVRQSTRAL
jgi:DNA-binding LacI/PurR family transcriptional regulator